METIENFKVPAAQKPVEALKALRTKKKYATKSCKMASKSR
jgi:hypothetical protein